MIRPGCVLSSRVYFFRRKADGETDWDVRSAGDAVCDMPNPQGLWAQDGIAAGRDEAGSGYIDGGTGMC